MLSRVIRHFPFVILSGLSLLTVLLSGGCANDYGQAFSGTRITGGLSVDEARSGDLFTPNTHPGEENDEGAGQSEGDGSVDQHDEGDQGDGGSEDDGDGDEQIPFTGETDPIGTIFDLPVETFCATDYNGATSYFGGLSVMDLYADGGNISVHLFLSRHVGNWDVREVSELARWTNQDFISQIINERVLHLSGFGRIIREPENLILPGSPFDQLRVVLCDRRHLEDCVQAVYPTLIEFNYPFTGGPYRVDYLSRFTTDELLQGEAVRVMYDDHPVFFGGTGTTAHGTTLEMCDVAYTPLMIDTASDGLLLSAPLDGVYFDINADDQRELISWPTRLDDMFLALPERGRVLSGRQLFGDSMTGPDGQTAPDGFAALAKYDTNHDGLIDSRDSVFSRLRLWSEKTRDGIGEPHELMSPGELGLRSIRLKSEPMRFEDPYGNQTLLRSVVRLDTKDDLFLRIFDVYFRAIGISD